MQEEVEERSNDGIVEKDDDEERALNNCTEQSTGEEDCSAMLGRIVERNENNSNDEGLLSASLTENTYSIMYVANPKRRAFYVGILIFLIQNALPLLTLFNLIDTNNEDGNFLKVPVDEDATVHAAGYITLILSVPYFPDLLDSIEKFQQGYHPEIVLTQCPYATRSKWVFAYLSQFCSGLLFQVVIFVLVVQSTDVIGMLLNFAALAFITEIDDLAFSLIDRGYFSDAMKLCCDDVKRLKTPTTSTESRRPWLVRRLALIFFILVVLIPYSVIVANQKAPAYSCERIEVQFGDGFWSFMPFYAGTYFVDASKPRKGGRLVYLDEMSNGQTSFFRYCPEYEAWVFGLFDNQPTTNVLENSSSSDNNRMDIDVFKSIDEQLDDVCVSGRWVSKSPATSTFDILDERSMDWITKRNGGSSALDDQSYPVDQFQMSCLDCSTETCSATSGGNSCEKDSSNNSIEYCKCQDDYIGSHCQYNAKQACDFLDYDHRFDPFPSPTPSRFEVAKENDGKTIVEFRGKTVYVYVASKELYSLIFHGRRYLVLLTPFGDTYGTFANSTVNTIVGDYIKEMKQIMKDGASPRLEGTSALLMSEPLDIGTPNDKATPTSIQWFLPGTNDQGQPTAKGAPVTTRLLCGTCNNRGPICGDNGKCDLTIDNASGIVNRQCACKRNIKEEGDGYVGPRCEAYVQNMTQLYEDQGHSNK